MVRERNTLKALLALEKEGCLTDQESRVLDDAYRFLRKTEHRLQVLFDLQTHKLPDKDDELNKLAQRMGYFSEDHKSPRELFLEEYKDRTSLTHRILEHLLHQTFSGDADQSEPESDIILDPNPEPDLIRAALEKYRFKIAMLLIRTCFFSLRNQRRSFQPDDADTSLLLLLLHC